MPVTAASSSRHDAGRARWAATLAFLTNGALLGALIPHYPEAKRAFDLDSGQFGLLVVTLTLGAACAGHLPAPILRRLGSRSTVLWGSAAIAVLVTAAGLAVDVAGGGVTDGAGAAGVGAGVWLLAAAVFAAGVGDAIVDTAQNAQGLRVQTVLGRPVLTSMHAGWSLGAALGAAAGALSVGLGAPTALHLGLNGLGCMVVLLAVLPRFLPDGAEPEAEVSGSADAETVVTAGGAGAEPDAPGTSAGSPRPALLLVPIVVVAMAGFSVEEFGNAWTSLFLQAERGVDPATAGLGASLLLGAQFAGRLVGDRVLARRGRAGALAGGLGVVVVGLCLTLFMPAPAAIAAGLVLAGLGCAVVVPTAYALADEVPGLAPQTGLAVVSWLMRLAGLGLSPLVGLLAGVLPLPAALSAFVLLAGTGFVLSLTLVLRGRSLRG